MSAVPHLRPAPPRTAGSGARAKATPRPSLRLVDAGPLPQRTVGFVLLCLALVVGGLLAALLLNTQRAESSFAVTDLQRQATTLHDQRVTLEAEVAALRSPEVLAERAEDLGMVRSPSTAMLRLSDGLVIGVAALVDDDLTRTVITTGPDHGAATSAEDAAGSNANASD